MIKMIDTDTGGSAATGIVLSGFRLGAAGCPA